MRYAFILAALALASTVHATDTNINGTKIVAESVDMEHMQLIVGNTKLNLTKDQAKELARFISYNAGKVKPEGYAAYKAQQDALKARYQSGAFNRKSN